MTITFGVWFVYLVLFIIQVFVHLYAAHNGIRQDPKAVTLRSMLIGGTLVLIYTS